MINPMGNITNVEAFFDPRAGEPITEFDALGLRLTIICEQRFARYGIIKLFHPVLEGDHSPLKPITVAADPNRSGDPDDPCPMPETVVKHATDDPAVHALWNLMMQRDKAGEFVPAS